VCAVCVLTCVRARSAVDSSNKSYYGITGLQFMSGDGQRAIAVELKVASE
jgi:uncharacterized protein with WD repeat